MNSELREDLLKEFISEFSFEIIKIVASKGVRRQKKAPTINASLVPRLPEKVFERAEEEHIPVAGVKSKVLPHPPSFMKGKGYKKIVPLLMDPGVYAIECPGPNKPLVVVSRGQRRITRIVLGEKEIKDILEDASEKAHIPISEGAFRVALDEYSLNAVVSDIIGSRFVISKNRRF